MIDKKIEDWIYKYNLDHKLFYSNFTLPKANYEIKNNFSTNTRFIKFDKYTNKYDFKIDSDFFYQQTSLSKWDYILQNYFNHFNITKFSKILLINISSVEYKKKIRNFYNVDNYVYMHHKKCNISKKYDLISIFPEHYKISNSDKNYNKIIFNITHILENILNIINEKTIVHIYFFHYSCANSLDLLFLLENYFDISFFSEYKLQDVDKTTIDIILSNGRDLNGLKKDLSKILKILNLKENNIGFLKYDYIPKQSCIFIYRHLTEFLNSRYLDFLKLEIHNFNKIKKIFEKIIFDKIFTQDIKHTNVLQIPMLVQLLNKDSSNYSKVGNILYNFVIKKKLNIIFQFGFYNGYLSLFLLTALNKLNVSKKVLLTIDSRQKEYYDNKGLKLFQKLNIFKNHLLIQDYIYNYIPKLITHKKKFRLIILHNILIDNFQDLMIEFYFALKIIDKNGYIYLEKINFPKIKKMINYIKYNLQFLNVYYENYFKNIIIFKVNDSKALDLYLSNNPIKEEKYTFKDF